MITTEDIRLNKDNSIQIRGVCGTRLKVGQPEDAWQIVDILNRAFEADGCYLEGSSLIWLLDKCADAELKTVTADESGALALPESIAKKDVVVAEVEGRTDSSFVEKVRRLLSVGLKNDAQLFVNAGQAAPEEAGGGQAIVRLVGLNRFKDDGEGSLIFKKIEYCRNYCVNNTVTEELEKYSVANEITIGRANGAIRGSLRDGGRVECLTPARYGDVITVADKISDEPEALLVDLRSTNKEERAQVEAFITGAAYAVPMFIHKVWDNSVFLLTHRDIVFDDPPLDYAALCGKRVTMEELDRITDSDDDNHCSREHYVIRTKVFSLVAAVAYRLAVFENLVIDDSINTLARTPSLIIFWCLAVLLPVALCALFINRRRNIPSTLVCALSGVGAYSMITTYAFGSGYLLLIAAVLGVLSVGAAICLKRSGPNGEYFRSVVIWMTSVILVCILAVFIVLAHAQKEALAGLAGGFAAFTTLC